MLESKFNIESLIIIELKFIKTGYLCHQYIEPAMLGGNWLSQLKLDWASLFTLNVLDPLHEFPELSKEGMGKVQAVQAKMTLSANARSVFRKARPVPFALHPQNFPASAPGL